MTNNWPTILGVLAAGVVVVVGLSLAPMFVNVFRCAGRQRAFAAMRLIKALGASIGAIAALLILATIYVVVNNPSGRDADISREICQDFTEAAGTNVLTGKHVSVMWSPSVNKTVLSVYGGSFTESEKTGLRTLATQIGRARDNRLVKVDFFEKWP